MVRPGSQYDAWCGSASAAHGASAMCGDITRIGKNGSLYPAFRAKIGFFTQNINN